MPEGEWALRPEDRYPTAQSLADDVEHWLADEPVTAYREAWSQRAWRWTKRHRTVVSTATAALLVGATLIAVGWFWYRRVENVRLARRDLAAELALDEANSRAGAARATKDLAAWTEAVSAARRAEETLRDQGGLTPLGKRAADTRLALQSELDQSRRTIRLLDDLKESRIRGSVVTDGHFDWDARMDSYRRAFLNAKIDLLGLSPEVAAARVRETGEAKLVTQSIEDWAIMALPAQKSRLLAIARLADPDPDRNRLRDAIETNNRATIQEFANRKDSKGNYLDSTLLAYGLIFKMDQATAESMLRQAYQSNPADLWINFSLAILARMKSPPRYDLALRYLTAALALDPTSPSVHLNMGIAYNESGDQAEAIAAYREALRIKPDFVEAYNNLGIALHALRDYPGAIGALKNAIRLDVRYTNAYVNLGMVLRDSGDLAGANAAYGKAIELNQGLAVAHDGLGLTRKAEGNLPGAISEYKEAIRLKPGYAGAYVNLGGALEGTHDVPGAIVACREAIRLDPGMPEAYTNLGGALREAGDHVGSLAAYREAVRLTPGSPDAQYNLGTELMTAGDPAGAMNAYKEAIRLKPGFDLAYNNLGNVLRKTGNQAGAIAAFQEAIRLNPGSPSAHTNLGATFYNMGRIADSVKESREAVRLKPDLAEAQFLLGIALRDTGDLPGAIPALVEAVRLKPRFADAQLALGLALYLSGDVSGAIAPFQEAIRLQPDLADAHANLGLALRASGDIEGAIPAYREAIRLNPNLALGYINLGLALQALERYDEAVTALRRGHELGTGKPGWTIPSEKMVREAERLAKLSARLPSILSGAAQPRDSTEALQFARLASSSRLYAASARLFSEALAVDPTLGDDRQTQHRYNAACASSLAASGKGKDVPAPDEAAKDKLRAQALDWLKAELDVWSRLLEMANMKQRVAINQTLQNWKKDSDLASVREENELAKLPKSERNQWLDLWTGVDQLLAKSSGPNKGPQMSNPVMPNGTNAFAR